MRRFTPVEIAIGVSLVAIIAAVSIPTFFRETHASRFVEPVEGLERIGVAAVAHAVAHNGQYPPSTPLTPGAPPRGKKEVDPPGAWDSPTWRALSFRAAPEGVPHAYAFAFDGNGSSFIAHTHGDLDGDGLTSTFEIRSKNPAQPDSPPGPAIEPGMYIESELE